MGKRIYTTSGQPMKPVMFRIELANYDVLKRIAVKNDYTFSDFMRHIVKRYLTAIERRESR